MHTQANNRKYCLKILTVYIRLEISKRFSSIKDTKNKGLTLELVKSNILLYYIMIDKILFSSLSLDNRFESGKM